MVKGLLLDYGPAPRGDGRWRSEKHQTELCQGCAGSTPRYTRDAGCQAGSSTYSSPGQYFDLAICMRHAARPAARIQPFQRASWSERSDLKRVAIQLSDAPMF